MRAEGESSLSSCQGSGRQSGADQTSPRRRLSSEIGSDLLDQAERMAVKIGVDPERLVLVDDDVVGQPLCAEAR